MLPLYDAKMAHSFDHRWNSYYATGDEDRCHIGAPSAIRKQHGLASRRQPCVTIDPEQAEPVRPVGLGPPQLSGQDQGPLAAARKALRL